MKHPVPFSAYAISIGALALTLALRWLLDPWLGDRQPLGLVFGAVAIAVWVGGWRPALVVIVAGYLACDWLFLDPRGEFGLRSFPDFIGAAVFLASCAIAVAFGEAMHRARAAVLASAQSLEAKHRELEFLNRELQEADRRKDDFVATLAHELRNLVAPMRNAVHIIRRAGVENPLLVNATDVADHQVAMMARLLEDLLDASRIRKGKVEVRKAAIDLRAVLKAAVETSLPAIESAKHAFSVCLPEDPIRMMGDPERLAQVFSNLLNNATKYTDPGGSIELRAEATGSTVRVEVSDTGIGFAPGVADELFSPFHQAEEANGRAQGGLGIGLALVSAIVKLHDGTVEAHSAGPGQGARFVVALPLTCPSTT